MTQRRFHYLAVLAMVLASTAVAAGGEKPAVQRAIGRGARYLRQSQHAQGYWPSRYARRYATGPAALAAWALVEAGAAGDDPAVRKALNYVTRVQPPTVFARASRIQLLAAFDADAHGKALAEDVDWLTGVMVRPAAWGYGPGHAATRARKNWVDNANSHWALWSVAAASGAGVRLKSTFWPQAARRWMRIQNDDGGWGFEPPGSSQTPLRRVSYGSMTAAGLAALLAAADHSPTDTDDPAGLFADAEKRTALLASAGRACTWLDKHYTLAEVPGWIWGGTGEEFYLYYTLALAEAGNAAGLARLNGRDWRDELATLLVQRQRPDGSWDTPHIKPAEQPRQDPVAQTAMALLTLRRCTAATVVNKIDATGRWSETYADARNLARHAQARLARACRWQYLPEPNLQTLCQAPVTYLDGSRKLAIEPPLARDLARYLAGGGMLVVQAGDADAAARTASYLASLLPAGQSRPLTEDHPVFSAVHRVAPLTGHAVSDGLATRALVTGADLAGAWAAGPGEPTAGAFDLFENILRLAGDGDPNTAPAPPRPPRRRDLPQVTRRVGIARIAAVDGWQLAPGAETRLGEVLAKAVNVGIRTRDGVDLNSAVPRGIDVLILTGRGKVRWTAAQQKHLRAFCRRGGVVLAESPTGETDFMASARSALAAALGDGSPAKGTALGGEHPLVTGSFGGGMGADLRPARYSPAVTRPPDSPILYAIGAGDALAAVVSPMGVLAPLSGTPAYGARTYAPDDARRLAANVVLYALWQQAQSPAPPRR